MHKKVGLHGHVLWLKQFFGGQYPFQFCEMGITLILLVGYFFTLILSILYKLFVCVETPQYVLYFLDMDN